MTDKTLTCRDCGNTFLFTAGEQEFFAQKGFTNEPTRCPSCRAARRSGQGSFSSGGGFGRSERRMFPATCAECGAETQVPFEPRGDKPVYCSNCFESRRSSYGGGSQGGRGGW